MGKIWFRLGLDIRTGGSRFGRFARKRLHPVGAAEAAVLTGVPSNRPQPRVGTFHRFRPWELHDVPGQSFLNRFAGRDKSPDHPRLRKFDTAEAPLAAFYPNRNRHAALHRAHSLPCCVDPRRTSERGVRASFFIYPVILVLEPAAW